MTLTKFYLILYTIYWNSQPCNILDPNLVFFKFLLAANKQVQVLIYCTQYTVSFNDVTLSVYLPNVLVQNKNTNHNNYATIDSNNNVTSVFGMFNYMCCGEAFVSLLLRHTLEWLQLSNVVQYCCIYVVFLRLCWIIYSTMICIFYWHTFTTNVTICLQ